MYIQNFKGVTDYKLLMHYFSCFFIYIILDIAMKRKTRVSIHKFLSLLAGLIVGETGHRLVALKNMMVHEVEEAKRTQSCHIIYVCFHLHSSVK